MSLDPLTVAVLAERDRRGTRHRPRPGVFVCQPARAGGEWGTCRRCSHRIAGLMDPDLFVQLAAKYPPILNQRIEWPTPVGAST